MLNLTTLNHKFQITDWNLEFCLPTEPKHKRGTYALSVTPISNSGTQGYNQFPIP
jgi:hypothetical protein